MAMDSGRNMERCSSIQELVQLVGTELLYSYTKPPEGFTEKVRIQNHCLPLLVNDTTYLYVRPKAVKYCVVL